MGTHLQLVKKLQPLLSADIVELGIAATESLAQAIVARIQELGPRQVRSLDGVIEDVIFSLPKNLTHPI
jgi:hypothetical protein